MSKLKKNIANLGVLALAAVLASYFKAKQEYVLMGLTFAVGGIILVLINVFLTFAAQLEQVPTNIAAGDSGFLNSSISATSTTITVSSITKYLNGVKTTGCFDTGSGFILVRDGAGRTEYASYGQKSCTSNITSLTDVRRGLNPTSSTGGFAPGVGLSFAAGASVRVINWPGFFNLAMYRSNINEMTGSGRIDSSITSHAILRANDATTTQRDSFKNPANGDFFYNATTDGLEFYRESDTSWQQFGSGSVVAATTTIAGKVEVATGSDLYLFISSGSVSKAPLALTTKNLIRVSSGAVLNNTGRLVITNERGRLDPSLLASGVRDTLNFINGSGHLAIPQGTGSKLIESLTSASSGSTINHTADKKRFTDFLTIGTGALDAGDVFKIHASGKWSGDAGNNTLALGIEFNTVVVGTGTTVTVNGTDQIWHMEYTLTVRSVGASGKVFGVGEIEGAQTPDAPNDTVRSMMTSGSAAAPAEATIDTTINNIVYLSADWTLADPDHSITLEQFYIEEITRLAP